MSTMMMVEQFATTAASRAEHPTAPVPKITIDEPASGLSTVSTAPAPVVSPQPSGPRISSGTDFGTFATERSDTLAKLAKLDWPKKWLETTVPPSPFGSLSAVLPSGRLPPKLRAGKFSQ